MRIRREPNTNSAILASARYIASQSFVGRNGLSPDGRITGYIRMICYSGQLADLKEGWYYTGYAQWACLSGILSRGGWLLCGTGHYP